MAKKEAMPQPTKLAEMAGAKRPLKGAVCVTDEKGVTHQYADERAAFEAWKDKLSMLEHRRGAFFVKASPAAAATERYAAVEDTKNVKSKRTK